MNLNDLYEQLHKEFSPLFKEEQSSENTVNATSEQSARRPSEP
jgi:hypothetical protein